jgi:anti-anti-sigma factor
MDCKRPTTSEVLHNLPETHHSLLVISSGGSGHLDINVTTEQGRVPVTVLHVKGNIDSTTYEAFQREAMAQIHAGAHDIIVDLHHVPYMSSAGLRALTQIYNALREKSETQAEVTKGVSAGTYKSSHFKLAAPGHRVLETLKMSGFDMFLDIQPSLKQALASF